MHTGAIKATRPTKEQPIPAKEVQECPKCHQKTNVRLLDNWHGRKRCFCSDCNLEYFADFYEVRVRLPVLDIKRLIDLWRSGTPLDEMAAKLRSDPDEIAIFVIDLVRKGRIGKRPNGAYGEPKKIPAAVREGLGVYGRG